MTMQGQFREKSQCLVKAHIDSKMTAEAWPRSSPKRPYVAYACTRRYDQITEVDERLCYVVEGYLKKFEKFQVDVEVDKSDNELIFEMFDIQLIG